MKTDFLCEQQNRIEFHRAAPAAFDAFEISLHTAVPEGNDQHSHEVSVEGYGRVTVARTKANWFAVGRTVQNEVLISFPTIKSGDQTATHVGIGSGGKIRRVVALIEPVRLQANRRVELEPGSLNIVDKDES